MLDESVLIMTGQMIVLKSFLCLLIVSHLAIPGFKYPVCLVIMIGHTMSPHLLAAYIYIDGIAL